MNRKLKHCICAHQMALLLCHITPSDSDPGHLELTILHTGLMACITDERNKATNIIQRSNEHSNWDKLCLYEEWRRSAEVRKELPRLQFLVDDHVVLLLDIHFCSSK